VVLEAVAVVHELGQVMDLDGAADLGRVLCRAAW